jgi:hypothetical protein
MPSQFTVASPGVTLSTGAAANVVSQALDLGTYMVWGQVNFALAVATATQMQVGLSTTSAVLPTQAGGNGWGPDPLTISPFGLSLLSDTISQQCGPTILTLAARTTVYLVAQAKFSLGTITACGTLCAIPIIGAGHNLLMS